MAESDQGEKTEEATQQRREDFRKRGQVAQTKELASVLLIFTGIIAIWFLGRFYLEQISQTFTASFGPFFLEAAKTGDFVPALKFAIGKTLILVLPVMGLVWLVAFASSVLQIGFLYNEEALQFKPERLDPLAGFKRIFSLRSLVEGVKATLKLSAVLAIAFLIIRSQLFMVPNLVNLSVAQMFVYLGDITVQLFGSVGFFMGVIAGLDFLFQKYDMEKQMMMTKQEIKEEMKSREGDPLIKARIKRIQREISNRRMMSEVPKADVIITNPTHIAVALKYDQNMVAPTLVAKGAELVAARIKELAKEHNIPIVENKPLARTIYKTLKLGQSIPRELYTAVAEVLSYVFKLKRRKV